MCPGFGRALITTHNRREIYMVVTQPSGRVVRTTYQPQSGYLFYTYKLGDSKVDRLPNILVSEEEHSRYFSLLGYYKEMVFQGQKMRLLCSFAEKRTHVQTDLSGIWNTEGRLNGQSFFEAHCWAGRYQRQDDVKKRDTQKPCVIEQFHYFISIAYDVNPYPTFSRYSLVSELQESTSPPPPPPPIDDT